MIDGAENRSAFGVVHLDPHPVAEIQIRRLRLTMQDGLDSADFGQARISTTTFQGSNINVEGRGLSCFYYATLTAGQRMNWQLRAGDRDCLSRIFTRAE